MQNTTQEAQRDVLGLWGVRYQVKDVRLYKGNTAVVAPNSTLILQIVAR